VFEGVERVAWEMKQEGVDPAFEVYKKRPDLPVCKALPDRSG